MSVSPDVSLVVPVFNEEDAIAPFLETVTQTLRNKDFSYDIVFVDDGSVDGTAQRIVEQMPSTQMVRLVRLSRNFGKEAALTAGIAHAGGRAVIPIDVDLQDPPELVTEFVRLWREGYDVVNGERADRDEDSYFKRLTAALFYKIFNKVSSQAIESNVGDFRLMDRKVVDAALRLGERNRFMKGIFAWVGFKTTTVSYKRPSRSVGQTKFNFVKLLKLAFNGLTSFSTAPLRVATIAGVSVAGAAILYTAIVLVRTLVYGRDVPGYASLIIVTLFLGAVQLLSLGILGEYIGRLYLETKQRPIYIVSEVIERNPSAEQKTR